MKAFIVLILLGIVSVSFCRLDGFGKDNGWQNINNVKQSEVLLGSPQCTYNNTVVTNIFKNSVELCILQWADWVQNYEANGVILPVSLQTVVCMLYTSGENVDDILPCIDDAFKAMDDCPNSIYVPDKQSNPAEDLKGFIQCTFDYIPTFMSCAM